MIKGAGSPGIYGNLARNLFRTAAGFSGDEIYKIEYQIRTTLSTDVLNKFRDQEIKFKEMINETVTSIGGRVTAEYGCLIKGVDLNPDQVGGDVPSFLSKQSLSFRSNGICFVPIDVKDYFPEELLSRYQELYNTNRKLRAAGDFIYNEFFTMTYTQLLSMLPLVERLWVGETPPIVPRELKNFAFRDNHEYNDLLETTLINAKILGHTKGWEIIPAKNYKDYIVNIHIQEPS